MERYEHDYIIQSLFSHQVLISMNSTKNANRWFKIFPHFFRICRSTRLVGNLVNWAVRIIGLLDIVYIPVMKLNEIKWNGMGWRLDEGRKGKESKARRESERVSEFWNEWGQRIEESNRIELNWIELSFFNVIELRLVILLIYSMWVLWYTFILC